MRFTSFPSSPVALIRGITSNAMYLQFKFAVENYTLQSRASKIFFGKFQRSKLLDTLVHVSFITNSVYIPEMKKKNN